MGCRTALQTSSISRAPAARKETSPAVLWLPPSKALGGTGLLPDATRSRRPVSYRVWRTH